MKPLPLSKLRHLPGTIPEAGTLTKELVIRRKIGRHAAAFDLRSRNAAKALAELPAAGEVSSFIIRGMFSGLDFLPAILRLAQAKAAEVYICTYGFSQRNIGQLCQLLDAGEVQKLWLICSHFTSKADTHKYNAAVAELVTQRRQIIQPFRNHAKAIAIRLEDGRTFCADGSINMRSAHCVEQAHVWNDPALFDLYRRYVLGICSGEIVV